MMNKCGCVEQLSVGVKKKRRGRKEEGGFL